MSSKPNADHKSDEDTLYVHIDAEGNRYLVPKYLLDQVQFQSLAQQLASEMPTDSRDSELPQPTNSPFIRLARGTLKVPTDPAHSTVEARRLHANILAARDKWGISYKDAAHRLYIASIGELQAYQEHSHTLESLLKDIDSVLRHSNHTSSPAPDKRQSGPLGTTSKD